MIRGGFAGWGGGETLDSRRRSFSAETGNCWPCGEQSCSHQLCTAYLPKTNISCLGWCLFSTISFSLFSQWRANFSCSGFGPSLLPAWRADRPCQDCLGSRSRRRRSLGRGRAGWDGSAASWIYWSQKRPGKLFASRPQQLKC